MIIFVTIACFLAGVPTSVKGQSNPAFNDPDTINAQNQIFYFDKNSDCNGLKKTLYNAEAIIRGSDISSVQAGPKTCTIILVAEGQFGGAQLEIQVISMNIQDCDTKVSIYEGDGPQIILSTYDCNSNQLRNMKRMVTSGNTATFVMTRRNVERVSYDVEIRVRPIRGGNRPGYENDYNRDNPFAFDKFDQEAIVGIVGGFYALVFLICVAVVIYWYRTFNGMNKEWETHQLAALKTGSVFGTTNQTAAPSRAWSVDMPPPHSRAGFSSHPSRKTGPPSEDFDSPEVYNEERFEARRLTSEKDGVRPRYATTNFSYSDREEDDPDHFQEKVITPRARAINRRRGNRSNRPPSYEEAVSDNVSEHSSEEYSSNASVGKKSLSSEEASSRRTRSSRSDSETPTQSESEDSRSGSESSVSSSDRRRRKGRARGARAKRPPVTKSRKSRAGRDSSNASDGGSGTTRSSRQQHATQPMAAQPMPYGAPGQFVPVMAAPFPMVPGYPPPHYPQDRQQASQHPSQPQVQPTDPPVYSYLVQRGYTPLDQLSGASQPSSQGVRRPKEPDTRLSSGVDYMRR
ncbi:hypothetical protein PoB_001102600 [Plakobranchus ocellatus]|uniref:Uncharacterized protein n=1 Tax=Plakobranchus ocellatus TaxID=259542 RepID=A0AAV3YQ45_9GAST|nr:hypothetical protein PoB_001102600 [Plakobranchus ocellatus]